MKLAQFKTKEEFHAWQAKASRGVDEHGQKCISVMDFPKAYPCVLVWDICEEQPDFDIDRQFPVQPTIDVLHYKYVYIGHFPVKHIKRGTYVYQVFQTSDDYD